MDIPRYLDRTAPVPLTCPECGASVTLPLGQLRDLTSLTCDECGHTFRVTEDDVVRALNEVQDEVRAFVERWREEQDTIEDEE